jgi:hypothetical protein
MDPPSNFALSSGPGHFATTDAPQFEADFALRRNPCGQDVLSRWRDTRRMIINPHSRLPLGALRAVLGPVTTYSLQRHFRDGKLHGRPHRRPCRRMKADKWLCEPLS